MKNVVMIGTRFDTMGGIASVVNVYRSAGLFQRFPIIYLATHRDGGAMAKLLQMLKSWFSFIGLLLTGKVGVLHAHVSSYASFWRKSLYFLPAFLFRVPTVLHLHGSEFAIFYEKRCNSLQQRFVRYIFDNVSRIVVLSTAWKSWVEGMTVNPHVVVIYNPVQVPKETTDWETRKNGAILFLGRLGKRKGTYDLVDAAAKLTPAHPETRLLLGGDGDLEQIGERATQLGCRDHLELLGWVSGTQKVEHLSTAKMYVLPSYNEGLPMSILEAMAAGLPILSTRVGGIPEAISDGVEGFLIDAGDIATLQDRLQRLLDDDALAQRMGEAARHKVQTCFSTTVTLPKLEVLYAEFGMSPSGPALS